MAEASNTRLDSFGSRKKMQAETEPTELALRSEAMDEEQIIAETKGDVIESYFNELPLKNLDGSPRVQLSYAGIKWVARIMATADPGKAEPLSVEEHYVGESNDGKSWLARAKCVNLKTREVRWGYAEQQRYNVTLYHTKDGDREELKPIPFAYVLAASKAQRNALRAFIPEAVIQSAYKEWKEKQRAHSPPSK